MDDIECAGYTFGSNFDSGNLAKVELVRCIGMSMQSLFWVFRVVFVM